MSMSFLYWRTQNWTQHSRSGLTSAGQRKIITFLHQLATLYLMQPRMLLNFLLQKLLVDLVPIRTTRSTIAKPLSSWSAPGLYQCLGYFSQGVRLEFYLLNFMRLLLANGSLSSSIWTAAQPSWVSTTHSNFVSSAYLHLPIIQVTDEDVKWYWLWYQPLQNSTSNWFVSGFCATEHIPFSPAVCPLSSLHHFQLI